MATLKYQISKLGLEDLLFGEGTETQVRGNKTVVITKINARNLPFDDLGTLKDILDTNYSALEVIKDNLAIILDTEKYAKLAEAASVNSQSIFNEFKTLYLGAQATDPTTDNEGNRLRKGASYYNTVLEEVKVFDGNGFVKIHSTKQVQVQYGITRTKESQILIANQKHIVLQKVAYDNSNVDVYLNGRLLDNSDITCDGTDVELKVGANKGDDITVVGYKGKTSSNINIVDNLNTSDSHSALSANMGVKLNDDFLDLSNKYDADKLSMQTIITDSGKIGSY